MASEIKTNSRGISRLLLNYPLELRLRCKRMAQTTQQPEQQIIRQGIEQIVAAWEAQNAEQPIAPEPRVRKPRTPHPQGVAPKTGAGKEVSDDHAIGHS